ncbi:S8 family peptidase [Paenibacillus thermotolerans]|uniref:S8 family peptidase n=1 Tax=Paenibacillus thermotolerans TaxID=3027807 RepID=UPI002368B6BF|nr:MULTISPECIES: S8 family peptidase [unclassified Paenibacillus]
MEAFAFAKMLNRLLSRSSERSAKRHIIRLNDPSLFRAVKKAITQSKKIYKRLRYVQPLPLISAFVCPGLPSPQLLGKFAGSVTVEEDVKISVHAIAVQDPESLVSPRFRKPFIPTGIRKLRVPSVWNRSMGDRVKIGVIDTGVDFLHPDLQPVLARGINLIAPHTLPFDDNGHGTHISGTIAASGRWGMSGIAPRATLYPVKAFDHNGSAYVSDIITGIDWCVQNGMNVINMSFGMKKRSEAMLEAVRNAARHGVVIVASSGNDGKSAFVDYPARFPQTISVGAIDGNGNIAPFSNRGKRIDVYAPGSRIMSTWPNRRYYEMHGTSMATSHVTGIVALLLSANPKLTPAELKRIVSAAQVPLPGKTKKARLPGRIDALKAFREMNS